MPLKFSLFLMFKILTLFFCLSFNSATENDFEFQDLTIPNLSCYPDTLNESTNLKLKISVPHGGDLGIIDPENTYYFAFRDGKAEPRMAPQPDFENFEIQSEFEIDPSIFKLRPYVYGVKETKLVFQKPGRYRIRLSKNLETDDGTRVFECQVLYKP